MYEKMPLYTFIILTYYQKRRGERNDCFFKCFDNRIKKLLFFFMKITNEAS